ncbi:MAG TPA: cytochrome c oxidase assembly protein, partial [Chloroflexota bacterium]|nr:cytochrome c oxidase assembly protein [Chloroflexota bacterium]
LAAALTHWNFEPSIVFGLIAATLGFVWLQRRPDTAVSAGRRVCFGIAIGLLVLALLSPLDEIADRYLLFAHMIQHLLLVLLVAPLVVRAMPRTWGQRLAINPWLAFAGFNVVFALSHVPLWYEAALVHEPLHVVEHVAYLAAGIVNWLPIANPAAERRLPDAMQMLYLFFETLPMFVVGALLALSDSAIYSFYVSAPRLAGISAIEDQSIAGLLMWIGGSFFYLGALTLVFFRWANRDMNDAPLPPRWERLGEGVPNLLQNGHGVN